MLLNKKHQQPLTLFPSFGWLYRVSSGSPTVQWVFFDEVRILTHSKHAIVISFELLQNKPGSWWYGQVVFNGLG